ncbi:hypothetical protein B0O99DRAFT_614324 [Bisporella sp. PMI_857]|nr:hypothetical protein B0O99DRAFT_614324 [Bisporella sp. PMI_857]
MAQPNVNDNWPPKSPHQALLSTPGGRDRLRRLAERTSPSPSATKRLRSVARGNLEDAIDLEDSGEDDEETLELKLQEIQARLKLKKLQKKTKQSSDTENNHARAGSAPIPRANSVATSRAQSRISELKGERLQRSKSQAGTHVEIPVSPIRRPQPIETNTSPKRVLLGIDKGVKAGDVSLRRAPSFRKPNMELQGPFLQRSGSQAGARSADTISSQATGEALPKTFNERLLATRTEEVERQERALRIQKKRSRGFDIDHEKMESFKETAVDLLPSPQIYRGYSREEVLASFNEPSNSLPRSRTASKLLSTNSTTGNADAETQSMARRPPPSISSNNYEDRQRSSTRPRDISEFESSSFEPFSSQHLSKRIIPHNELTRLLSGKKTFLVPDLLRTVKSPDFSGPDIEEDVVVFAIIASKSDPKSHQPNAIKKNDNRGKFMIMVLTDLKWELDLFLFDTAFDQFWKLTPGTIIAILNPGFMPPPKGREATGKFSLTLNSNADTILEVGSARDLGFCKSIKKDGKVCDSWVDRRHTEFCSFHVNLTLEKSKSNRAEISSMTFGKARGRGGAYSGGGYGERRFNSKDMTGVIKSKEEEKTRYDRESHSQIFISKRSTANLLDDVDYDADAFHRGSKEERIRKQVLAKEKERELAKKLGGMGTGLGADYMRQRGSRLEPSSSSTQMQAEPPPDAASLGLLSGKAKDVQLGPIKRKRMATASSTAAVGWGGTLSKELGRMKNGENLQPVKKTRFVTEKGIREAGRESIGGDAVRIAANDLDDDDDDDDLDIVRE